MNYWLLKTEPGEYAFAELVACGDKGDYWDGVRNHQAQGFMREMAVGDRAVIYHSGKSREVVGEAEVIRAAYPDPTDESGRFVAVDLRAVAPFAAPLPLSTIKADPLFADCLLVRQSRLSVLPLSRDHWRGIQKLTKA